MSEMTQHVLSAIVDQIPDDYLDKAYKLIRQRLGWKSVYTIDAEMWCFTEEIAERVESTLEEIGQWSKENEEHWRDVCEKEWVRRFSDPEADIFDYECVLSDYTIQEIQNTIRDDFVQSDDVHNLMRDTILKHYKVAP